MEPRWTAPGSSSPAFSLADAGFSLVELDEGWEGHGEGNQSAVHDASGDNRFNTHAYPDMSALVAFGHASGLKIGWSLNNGNAEDYCSDLNMQGDIKQAKQLGFDSLRFFGYGPCRNATRYAELMRESGKSFMVASRAPEFGARIVFRHRKRMSSFFLFKKKMGCADTVPFQPKPNTPF